MRVVRHIALASESGPVVMGAMLWRAGEPWRPIDREPVNGSGALRARAAK
jgi:hypothetical protein